MSTRTVRKPFYGEYHVEGGPSLEGLNQVNGQGRNKELSLRDKSVAFHLKRSDNGEKRVIRMTITSVDPAPELTSSDQVYAAGFIVGSSNYGRVTVLYNTSTRVGEMEIMPLAPRGKPHKLC